MWLVRFMMSYALPRSLGMKRLMVGPGSTQAADTYKALRFTDTSCSFALATAERMTFSTSPLARCLENWSNVIASSTFRPRTRSTIRRAFRGAMRQYLCFASNGIANLYQFFQL